MQKTVLFILFGLYTMMASAVPAKRERCTLTLADGSTIEATWSGDELLHFYLTDDGQYLLCGNNGIAHFVEPDIMLNRRKAKADKRKAVRAQKALAKPSSRQKSHKAMSGSKRGLVILVQYPGTDFSFPQATFQNFFNEIGYSDDINIGSVRDYFIDASYGQFDFTFDVIGPITMSRSLSYYGGNNSNGDDAHPAEMVAEAVGMVDNVVDFKIYDWNGDGEVEHLFILHSGYDEAQSRKASDIWSHAWTLSEAKEEGDGNGPVEADGVVIDNYATSSELRDRTGTKIVGIGTACHEFAHCFGLPDFYDTEGSCFGMKSWDLMDYGEYNGDGGTPAGFTSYERMFCGWLQPIELTDATIVRNMPSLTSQPIAYMLKNSGNDNEYYLLENRQQESWDKYLGGHGLLILHVDYDSQAWAENRVNTIRTHQRMTIIPADNMLHSFSLAGDPWPGTSRKTELSDTSTPAATLFNTNAEGDKLMHHSFTEISETSDGCIDFTFDEEALGISTPEFTKLHPIYDLSGRRVNKGSEKGIYIQDGKKIMIR